MKLVIFVCIIFWLNVQSNHAQNLILNSSFSNVKIKSDSKQFYKILPGQKSEVSDWYLPHYIDYKAALKKNLGINLNEIIHYYSSRDKNLIPTDKKYHYNVKTNSDQLFENNLGFMYFYIDSRNKLPFIQQKLEKPLSKGWYCFKFKYKFFSYNSTRPRYRTIEFAFSPTNLQEYYDKILSTPDSLIKVTFKDTINEMDDNSPWIQECKAIYLNSNEQFLSIGSLTNTDNYTWGQYFIDDVELYSDTSMQCNCEKFNKDLSKLNQIEFPINKVISNDTMIVFRPENNIGAGVIDPMAKKYLQNIISFMQRHPDVKIKLIEYTLFEHPLNCFYFTKFLLFYDIDKDRIKEGYESCIGLDKMYCGQFAEFAKIGFIFYKE